MVWDLGGKILENCEEIREGIGFAMDWIVLEMVWKLYVWIEQMAFWISFKFDIESEKTQKI